MDELYDTNRRIAERLGWELLDPNVECINDQGAELALWRTPEGKKRTTPDFHAPAVFWSAFLSWCEQTNASYRIDIGVYEHCQFVILKCGTHKSAYPHTDLRTMMEAACEAWLAALDGMEGK